MNAADKAQVDQNIAEIDETITEMVDMVTESLDAGFDIALNAVALRQTAEDAMEAEALASVLSVATIRLAQAHRAGKAR